MNFKWFQRLHFKRDLKLFQCFNFSWHFNCFKCFSLNYNSHSTSETQTINILHILTRCVCTGSFQRKRAHVKWNLFYVVFRVVSHTRSLSNTHSSKHTAVLIILEEINVSVSVRKQAGCIFWLQNQKTEHQNRTSWHHSLQFLQTQTALYRAEATQLRLQMEPSTGGWGAEGVYRLGLWGCIGERLFSVFSIQPKSSKTSSSLLRAASWDLI